MGKPLQVLLVEDSPDDGESIIRELERGGYDLTTERVETVSAVRDRPGRKRWEMALSGYDVPRFSGPAALDVLKAVGQSEAQYRSLVDRALFGIYRATVDGRILTANPALVRMLGYSTARELLTVSLNDVYVDKTARDALITSMLEHGRIAGEEVMWQPRSGEAMLVRLSGAVVEGSSSRSPVFEVIVEDITKRRRLHEQLRQAQKMEAIGHLAGGIAHDFNNLLTAILGYSELLTEQIGTDKPIGRDLREILSAAQRAAALTGQLLAFSRRQAIALTALDLNQVIGNLETMLRRLLGEKVKIETVLVSQLRPVMADATQLEQVLINLAVNARDAMPQGGTLTIETRHVDLDTGQPSTHFSAKPGPYALLSVTDTGMGMSRETQTRIFEPFFTTKERGRGTGLGLAAVYGIVHQLGGFICVESDVGRGTVFQVYLPETLEAIESVPEPTIAMSAAGNETILLVEDEDAVRAFIKTVLRRFGYRVLETSSAESALTLLRGFKDPIHLLLTDVILPKLDGRELALRVTRSHPSAQILFISGYPDGMTTPDGFLESGWHLLEKPFTAQSLLSRIRQLLGR